MQENKHQESYSLEISLDSGIVSSIKEGSGLVVVNSERYPNGLLLKVNQIGPVKKDIFTIIQKDIRKLFEAVFIPLKKGASKSKLLSLSFVYTLLIPSGVAVFFIRGWRFGIVKRMIKADPDQAISPNLNSLHDLGVFIRDGIRLFGAKALYDLPKLLILVAIGYDHIELIIDWIYFFLTKVPGMGDYQSFAEKSIINFSTTLLIQLIFFMIASFLITPAFKISMIKYANGNISYAGFFSMKEIKDSYRIYQRYKTRTLTAYIWDVIVTGLSTIIGFILMILFPFIIWLAIPLYKLLFKHWPKAYAYGMLARRLAANGEI